MVTATVHAPEELLELLELLKVGVGTGTVAECWVYSYSRSLMGVPSRPLVPVHASPF